MSVFNFFPPIIPELYYFSDFEDIFINKCFFVFLKLTVTKMFVVFMGEKASYSFGSWEVALEKKKNWTKLLKPVLRKY